MAALDHGEPREQASLLQAGAGVRGEFEKRLKDEEGFAASPLRRLQFFYERSPFYDNRYLLYPVGREL